MCINAIQQIPNAIMLGTNKSMRKITYYENILEFKDNTREELNLNEINHWKLCRTCMVETTENDVNIEKMSVMDVMQGSILNLKQMLIDTTGIEMSTTENLPMQVCSECFSKITELYYFCIQVRKAESVLSRLANTFKESKNSTELSEMENTIEVEVYAHPQHFEDISDVTSTSIDKNTNFKEEYEKLSDAKDSTEFFKEISDIEAELLKDNEAEILKDEEEVLLNDEESVLMTESEHHTTLKSTLCEEGHLEKDLIECIDTSDSNDGIPSISNTTKVIYKIKPPKKRGNPSTSGYRHKQPRVTSPLLDDFDCAICQISFGRQQDLVQHVRDSHPNSKAYKCRVCYNLFSHIQSLSRHMNTHKEAVILNECDYCSKSFVRVDDLKRHLRIHTGERSCTYICSICEKSFQQQSDLKRHQRKHFYEDMNLQTRTFECKQCKRSYASRTGLSWHKRKYHTQNSLDCSLCQKSFHKDSDLKLHSEDHFLPQSNEYSECKRSFSSEDEHGAKEAEKENKDDFTMLDEEDRRKQ